ncbi:2-oxoglutarate and iron-dependent oxygenase domain-containing protein [uncultured Ruegeria sp.]|uniref:isopenicillin N synthase family dioxygenase n=1 Tax=uncultured Ruegeria sp. TaxID=259304 RepID=UPI00260EC3DA|nr:2-oxoglutarate and iron-dependent oxygenase domain-containing protein [uncultured Ruegeria sp.]
MPIDTASRHLQVELGHICPKYIVKEEAYIIPYTSPKPALTVPLIDLGPAFSNDVEGKKKVVQKIHKACVDSGFFYVKNHGVPQEAMDQQLRLASQFFDLPLDEKLALRCTKDNQTRGYEPLGAQKLDVASLPDLKEGFIVSSIDVDRNHRYSKMDIPGMGRNQWPDSIPGFRTQYENYCENVGVLGRKLAGLLALSLNLPEDYFADGFEEPLMYCRILKYPPMPNDAKPNQLGAGAHTDWGFLTLLLQDDLGGLEVQTADGNWIAAPPVPGTYLINLGEMLPVITSDLYKATMHRVMNNYSNKVRFSCPTFFDPEYFYKVECAPTCIPKNGKPKYPPLTAGGHMWAQFEKSFGTTGQ